MNFLWISLLAAQAAQTGAPGPLTTGVSVTYSIATMIYAPAPVCEEPPQKQVTQGGLTLLTCPRAGPLMATVDNGKVALEPGYTYEEVIVRILEYADRQATEQYNRSKKELKQVLDLADKAIKNSKVCATSFEQFRTQMEKDLKGISAALTGMKGNGK